MCKCTGSLACGDGSRCGPETTPFRVGDVCSTEMRKDLFTVRLVGRHYVVFETAHGSFILRNLDGTPIAGQPEVAQTSILPPKRTKTVQMMTFWYPYYEKIDTMSVESWMKRGDLHGLQHQLVSFEVPV